VRHRRFVPARFAGNPPFQNGGDDVVAVLKNVRFDRHIVSDNTFSEVSTTVYQGS